MKNEKKLKEFERKLIVLKNELIKVGLIVQGSIMERIVKRKSKRTGEELLSGPYYQWTRKIKGKTVNINLNPNELEVYKQAMENNKKFDGLIEEIRKISFEIFNLKHGKNSQQE